MNENGNKDGNKENDVGKELTEVVSNIADHKNNNIPVLLADSQVPGTVSGVPIVDPVSIQYGVYKPPRVIGSNKKKSRIFSKKKKTPNTYRNHMDKYDVFTRIQVAKCFILIAKTVAEVL